MDSSKGVMLVTGGARGIGAATCAIAAEAGYDVAVGYVNAEDRAKTVVAAALAAGRRAIAVQADVRDPQAVARAFDQVQAELGPVTALVNSAGITGPGSSLADADPGVLKDVVDVNVLGTLWPCREAARRMSTTRGGAGGAIVNVSSGAATLGSAGEFVWYAASKGAIDTLTMGLAKELAREGVRVNAVSPGLTETELHALSTGEPGRVERMAPGIPVGRAATAEEIARPILWLCSEEASYVTGAILRAAGGR